MADREGEIKVYRKLFDVIERESKRVTGSSIGRGNGSSIICC